VLKQTAIQQNTVTSAATAALNNDLTEKFLVRANGGSDDGSGAATYRRAGATSLFASRQLHSGNVKTVS
jgi:hypothetical protein